MFRLTYEEFDPDSGLWAAGQTEPMSEEDAHESAWESNSDYSVRNVRVVPV